MNYQDGLGPWKKLLSDGCPVPKGTPVNLLWACGCHGHGIAGVSDAHPQLSPTTSPCCDPYFVKFHDGSDEMPISAWQLRKHAGLALIPGMSNAIPPGLSRKAVRK
jgi:hypothetical protein